jgi:hypothetical protein
MRLAERAGTLFHPNGGAMRVLLISLLLCASPAWGQSMPIMVPPGQPVPAPPPTEPGAGDLAPAGEEPRLHAAEERAAAVAAQPTAQGFLYQVLLAAVTALVTALIWKAVF